METHIHCGNIPFQHIFYQPVQRGVFGGILRPAYEIIPLLIKIFIRNIEQDFVFAFIVVIEGSLGNAGSMGDFGKGDIGKLPGFNSFTLSFLGAAIINIPAFLNE